MNTDCRNKGIEMRISLKPGARRGAVTKLVALLLIAAMLAAALPALSRGVSASISGDYGITIGAGMSTYECEDGYVWAPSPTNINGQCVPE